MIGAHRAAVRPFLRWAIDSRRILQLTLLPGQPGDAALISQQARGSS